MDRLVSLLCKDDAPGLLPCPCLEDDPTSVFDDAEMEPQARGPEGGLLDRLPGGEADIPDIPDSLILADDADMEDLLLMVETFVFDGVELWSWYAFGASKIDGLETDSARGPLGPR